MIDAELNAELDRLFDGVAELIKQVVERMETRLERGFENLGQRMERLDTRNLAVEMQLVGIDRRL